MTTRGAVSRLVSWARSLHMLGFPDAHWTVAYHKGFMCVLWRTRGVPYAQGGNRCDTFAKAVESALAVYERGITNGR